MSSLAIAETERRVSVVFIGDILGIIVANFAIARTVWFCGSLLHGLDCEIRMKIDREVSAPRSYADVKNGCLA